MITVLLTGAGGVAIPGLINQLQRDGYRVLAADMDQYAVGLYLADSSFVIPAGKSPSFLPVIRRICKQERVNVLVPLVDEELITSLELEKDGVIVLLPRREFVATCLDKFLLVQSLQSSGILAPKTRLASSGLGNMSFPIVVKPRTGRGSRGVGMVRSERELLSFLNVSPYTVDQLILQEYIEGPEFTVSVIVWRDGEVQAVVPKEIISKRGVTRLAVTRRNFKIEELCYQIQEKLQANGPFNVQLRIRQATGHPIPFEINPRFSTSISLTIAAGINELEGLIRQAIGGKSEHVFADWQEGLVLLRQTLDQFVDESFFQKNKPIKLEVVSK